jgi:excisionase family DNA binding protein
MRRPVDPVTLAEAAAVLGCSVSSVRRHVAAGRLRPGRRRYKHRALSRADVEALAAAVYDWRRHVDDPDSYWLTGQRAADVYGVNRARLSELSRADRLPFVVHRDGSGCTGGSSSKSRRVPATGCGGSAPRIVTFPRIALCQARRVSRCIPLGGLMTRPGRPSRRFQQLDYCSWQRRRSLSHGESSGASGRLGGTKHGHMSS